MQNIRTEMSRIRAIEVRRRRLVKLSAKQPWYRAKTRTHGDRGEREAEHDAAQRGEVDAPPAQKRIDAVRENRDRDDLRERLKARKKIIGYTVRYTQSAMVRGYYHESERTHQ